MAFEYQMLTLMTFFFLVAWLPSSLAKWKSFGAEWLGTNRDPIPGKEMVPWGARAERAYNNLKDYYPGFVVAIFLLGLNQKFDHGTAWASALYVAGRLGHMTFYIAGSVRGRSLSYFLAMGCNFYLLAKVLI